MEYSRTKLLKALVKLDGGVFFSETNVNYVENGKVWTECNVKPYLESVDVVRPLVIKYITSTELCQKFGESLYEEISRRTPTILHPNPDEYDFDEEKECMMLLSLITADAYALSIALLNALDQLSLAIVNQDGEI